MMDCHLFIFIKFQEMGLQKNHALLWLSEIFCSLVRMLWTCWDVKVRCSNGFSNPEEAVSTLKGLLEMLITVPSH